MVTLGLQRAHNAGIIRDTARYVKSDKLIREHAGAVPSKVCPRRAATDLCQYAARAIAQGVFLSPKWEMRPAWQGHLAVLSLKRGHLLTI